MTLTHKRLETSIIAFMIFLYALLSPPFVFSSYLPFLARTTLQTIPLLLFLMVCVSEKNKSSFNVLVGLWAMLGTLTIINSRGVVVQAIASVVTLVSLFAIVHLLKNSKVLFEMVRKGWFLLWLFISLSAICAFVAFQLHLAEFRYLDFSTVNKDAPYIYYNNWFLGNLRKNYLFGTLIPKIHWYVFEGSLLAFFLGLNVFLSDSLFSGFRRVKLFRAANVLAGLTTFSTTFLMFIIVWGTIRMVRIRRFKRLSIVLVSVVGAFCIWYIYSFMSDPNITRYTSLADRTLRNDAALFILQHSSPYEWLFGSGLDAMSRYNFDRGISTGWLLHLVQRGAVTLVFLLYLVVKYGRRYPWLLLYLCYFELAIDFFFYPAFYVAIALVHANGLVTSKTLPVYDQRGVPVMSYS